MITNMLLLKNANIYAPDPLGINDVLIINDKIQMIKKNLSIVGDLQSCLQVYDCKGNFLIPGIIDSHIHLIGGGGEDGFYSRTPRVNLSALSSAGITTVIGLLGTDGITRSPLDLLAHIRALEEEGITAYMYIGSYEVPIHTITDSIRKDIITIDKIIGVGEIAISDHRSSQPTQNDIQKLIAQARVGGMLSGKSGLVNIHVGNGKRKLSLLHDIFKETELPIKQVLPTHLNRSQDLLDDSIIWAKRGGNIDITASVSFESEKKIKDAAWSITYLLNNNVSIERITLSSDGNGSMPKFNEHGDLVGITIAHPKSLFEQFRKLILVYNVSLENAVKITSYNVASRLALNNHKGVIKEGYDADLILLDKDYNLSAVWARGNTLMRNKKLCKYSTFEK